MTNVVRCDVCDEIVQPVEAYGPSVMNLVHRPYKYKSASTTAEYEIHPLTHQICGACLKAELIEMLRTMYGVEVLASGEGANTDLRPVRTLAELPESSAVEPATCNQFDEWSQCRVLHGILYRDPSCKYHAPFPSLGSVGGSTRSTGGQAGETLRRTSGEIPTSDPDSSGT